MPKEYGRPRRVAELIHRELAAVIANDTNDPRLKLITITAVDVSSDLRHAKVFVTHLGDSSQRQEVLRSLRHAGGYLRRELSHLVELKVMPRLHFEYDVSLERGIALSQLIDKSGPAAD